MERIVVGVDESAGAAEALRWAVQEGRWRGWPVVAVLAWDLLHQHAVTPAADFEPHYDEAAAQRALDEIVEGVVGPGWATIERRVVCDLPAPALLGAVDAGDLLVVGARGLSGFKGLLLGSVSDRCVRHAPCPVVVVRGGPDGS